MSEDKQSGECEFLWGAEAIAEFLGLKVWQVRYLIKHGSLDGAVMKLGHRTIVGSRRKLRALVGKEGKA